MSKHALIMLLCCLIPIGVLAILWATGASGTALTALIVLLCPLLHIVMMWGMNRGKGHSSEESGHEHH